MTNNVIEIALKFISDGTRIYLNIISAVCGLVVVVIIGTLGLLDRKLIDRVSIRFTMAISLVDLLKAVVMLEYTKGGQTGAACIAMGYLFQSFTLLYMFLNVAIAINLQLVFVKGMTFDPRWERSYWFLSIFLAFGLPLFPLVAGRFGLAEINDNRCEYKNFAELESCIWISTTFLAWVFASILYCTAVVVLTIAALYKKVSVLDKMAERSTKGMGARRNLSNPFNSQQASPEDIMKKTQTVKKDLKKLIRRVAMYCVIPVITQIWFLIARSALCFNYTNNSMRYLSIISTDLPGILNLLALLIDPAFTNAISNLVKLHWPRTKEIFSRLVPGKIKSNHRHHTNIGVTVISSNIGLSGRDVILDGNEGGLLIHGKFTNLSDTSSVISSALDQRKESPSPSLATKKSGDTDDSAAVGDTVGLVNLKESIKPQVNGDKEREATPNQAIYGPTKRRLTINDQQQSQRYTHQSKINRFSIQPGSCETTSSEPESLIHLNDLILNHAISQHSHLTQSSPSTIPSNSDANISMYNFHEDEDKELKEFIRGL